MPQKVQAQAQLKCNLKSTLCCNLTCTLLCIFLDMAKCILLCPIKRTLRSTLWLLCQFDHELGIKCIFLFTFLGIFKCCLKWNLSCTPVQHRVPSQVQLFIESFCAFLCPKKCTRMRMFKCNSIVTSSAPLISNSNAISCTSLYRSQSTPLGGPSDEPSVGSSVALTNAPSNAFLKWTLRSTVKYNINSTMKSTF